MNKIEEAIVDYIKSNDFNVVLGDGLVKLELVSKSTDKPFKEVEPVTVNTSLFTNENKVESKNDFVKEYWLLIKGYDYKLKIQVILNSIDYKELKKDIKQFWNHFEYYTKMRVGRIKSIDKDGTFVLENTATDKSCYCYFVLELDKDTGEQVIKIVNPKTTVKMPCPPTQDDLFYNLDKTYNICTS